MADGRLRLMADGGFADGHSRPRVNCAIYRVGVAISAAAIRAAALGKAAIR